MSKISKTNPMRILDKEKITYNILSYEIKDNLIDGVSVAKKIEKSQEEVFKTLVCVSKSNEYLVFILPVNQELDLKKGAKLAMEKNIDLIPHKDLLKITGYIKGGCSPIAMKKQYKTFLHESVKNLDKIIVSAGKIGLQLELKVEDFIRLLDVKLGDISVN